MRRLRLVSDDEYSSIISGPKAPPYEGGCKVVDLSRRTFYCRAAARSEEISVQCLVASIANILVELPGFK